MKLAIFTPIVKISAIARATALVIDALYEKGHAVQIIRTEAPSFFDDPIYDIFTGALEWNDFEAVKNNLEDVDGIIYQVGDNYPFHQGSLEWLPKLSGIVCLHDFFVANLFCAYAKFHAKEAKQLFQAWFGNDNLFFLSYTSSQDFIEGMRIHSPMTEWICSMAAGVITHSHWEIERVLSSCPGPVYVTPLPYYDKKQDIVSTKMVDNKDSKFKLLTIGHVNMNKRIDKIIESIGLDPILREHMAYIIVGFIDLEMKEKLYTLAKQYQVDLKILGEVDDVTLKQTIIESDAISCLRWPVLEAASASAIEGMLYAKPIMVTDAGFYAELPDDYVKKVDPNNEMNAISETLHWFYENTEKRQRLGLVAQQWAIQTFTPENYAEKLIEMVFAVNKAKSLIEASQFFVKMMHEWGSSERLINLKDTLEPLSIFEADNIKFEGD